MAGVAGSVWSGRRRRRYCTFAPVTNPRQGQMYAVVVFGGECGCPRSGGGQMLGHVMLAGGRGLRTTAVPAVHSVGLYAASLRYWQPATVHNHRGIYSMLEGA